MAHGRLTKVSRPAKKATEATGRHLCHAVWFGFLSPAGVAWRRVARSASVRRHWLIRTLTRCLEVQESSLGMEQASRVKLCGAPAEIEKKVNNVRSSTAAAGVGAGGRMKNGRLTPPSASGNWTTLAAATAVEDLLAFSAGTCASNMFRGPLLVAPPGPAQMPTRSMSVVTPLCYPFRALCRDPLAIARQLYRSVLFALTT